MDFNKHALVLKVVQELSRQDRWSGKTHVQKTLFLLDASDRIEVPFQYILYKHGPYSFDLEEELEEMKSYDAIRTELIAHGYGPSLRPGPMVSYVTRKATLPPEQGEFIRLACELTAHRKVAELERLATAAWVRSREAVTDAQEVATHVRELKPHVSLNEALQADQKYVLWADVARSPAI